MTHNIQHEANRIYSAKLILLGEYSVLAGSKALAIPYPRYFGKWALSPPTSNFRKRIHSFFEYLDNLSKNDKHLCQLTVSSMWTDLENGLFFSSNIPIGSGLGSSGAISAAILARYLPITTQNILIQDPILLKEKLGLIESFFHGSSSGIDPLVSYLNKPVLIDHTNSINVPVLPEEMLSKFYILDTQIPRNTEMLVKHFQEIYAQQSFKSIFNQDYIPLIDGAIEQLINAESIAFNESIQAISKFQYYHMSFFIPQEINLLWQKGIISREYSMKLCGAGGGGSMLIYSHSTEALDTMQKEFDIKGIR